MLSNISKLHAATWANENLIPSFVSMQHVQNFGLNAFHSNNKKKYLKAEMQEQAFSKFKDNHLPALQEPAVRNAIRACKANLTAGSKLYGQFGKMDGPQCMVHGGKRALELSRPFFLC